MGVRNVSYLCSINGFEIQTGPYGRIRLTGNWCSLNRIYALHKKYSGWVSRVKLKLGKKKKIYIYIYIYEGVDVMQSQNTPSPQNKIEMKSTNLIFTLHLLRFPVFLLQSSGFAFWVYSSCLFRVSFLLLSLVPKATKPREIKSQLKIVSNILGKFLYIWRMNCNFYLLTTNFFKYTFQQIIYLILYLI